MTFFSLFKARNYLFFKLSFGLLILFLLYSFIGFSSVLIVVSSISLSFLFLYILLKWLSLFFNVCNIALLLRSFSFQIPFSSLMRVTFFSWSYGLLIPGKIGEFSLAYFLHKYGFPYSNGFAVAFVDKILTFFVLVLYSLLGFWLFLPHVFWPLVLVVLFLFLFFFYFFFTKNFLDQIVAFFLRSKNDYFVAFKHAVRHLILTSPVLVLFNLLITAFKWFFTALTITFLFFALGQHVNIFTVLFVQSMVTLASLLPFSVSGVGISEPLGIFLYSSVGVPPPVAGALFLVALAVTYLLAALNFFLFSFFYASKK